VPALTAILTQIIANNRADGWRNLKGQASAGTLIERGRSR